MTSSKDTFIQFQEAEYQESEIGQLKQDLLVPAVTLQQAPKTKKNAKSRKP
jgi:hypothetical protein